MNPSDEARLQSLLDAERSQPWADVNLGTIARLLAETAECFLLHGEAMAGEISERMGVTPGEVWLETIFPSVWGLLSTRRGLLANGKANEPLRRLRGFSARLPSTEFAGRESIEVLPANVLERVLLPGFTGRVLIKQSPRVSEKPVSAKETPDSGLALYLMPFNLISIGVLDIIHLLCRQQQRVIAKLSEKVEFVRVHLERVLAPLIESNALSFMDGGPEVGASLASRPEFSHIHVTGSARTASALARIVDSDKMTAELGGVTLAIVFPDALLSEANQRDVARQVAFGALANNGQHCVSFQIVVVPATQQESFTTLLSHEFALVAGRPGSHKGSRKLVDKASAERLAALTAELGVQGAQLMPKDTRAAAEYFPACLIQGIDEKMRIFSEEAFGPIAGLLALPVEGFAAHALAVANSAHLSGDLGISLFTSRPHSAEICSIARDLRHGIVTINTYPGVAFATSTPWGAGHGGMSGTGWVHNYGLLPESQIEKVVLTAPLGRKGFGPIRWEDPWLLNVSGENTVRFGRALVQLTLAYFLKQPARLVKALPQLFHSIRCREAAVQERDRLRS